MPVNAPLSVKGVLLVDGRVLLLRNERAEWELPGGRPEPGETEPQTLVREFREELTLQVEVVRKLDSYQFEVLPSRQVSIATYGCRLQGEYAPVLSKEHDAYGLFELVALPGLPLPQGYARSILAWSAS